jgi:hypothetical protein
MADTKAAVEGTISGSVSKIVVKDGHAGAVISYLKCSIKELSCRLCKKYTRIVRKSLYQADIAFWF